MGLLCSLTLMLPTLLPLVSFIHSRYIYSNLTSVLSLRPQRHQHPDLLRAVLRVQDLQEDIILEGGRDGLRDWNSYNRRNRVPGDSSENNRRKDRQRLVLGSLFFLSFLSLCVRSCVDFLCFPFISLRLITTTCVPRYVSSIT